MGCCVTAMSFRSSACSGEMNIANKPTNQRSIIVVFLSEAAISRKTMLRLLRPSARRPGGRGDETALPVRADMGAHDYALIAERKNPVTFEIQRRPDAGERTIDELGRDSDNH